MSSTNVIQSALRMLLDSQEIAEALAGRSGLSQPSTPKCHLTCAIKTVANSSRFWRAFARSAASRRRP